VGTTLPPPPPPRRLGASVRAGGYSSYYDISYNSTFAFSPVTKTWTRLGGTLRTGRGDFTGTDLNGLIYVYGGYSSADFCVPLATTEVYSPANDSWTPGPNLPVNSAEKDDGVVVDGSIFAIGGETKRVAVGCTDPDIVPLRGVYSYKPGAASSGWVNETYLPDGRMRFAAAESGGIVYVIGGQGLPIDDGAEIPLIYTVLAYAVPSPSPSPAPGSTTYFGYTPSELGGGLAGMFLGTLLLIAIVVVVVVCVKKQRRKNRSASAASDAAKAQDGTAKLSADGSAAAPRLSEIYVTPDLSAASATR
jgi:hypothetical protein